MLFPVLAVARTDAMAPPAMEDTSDTPVLADKVAGETAPNLNDALGSTDDDTGVDIRSYQRKDGAKVTEYGRRGHVFKIKVEPAGGLPAYYLYPNAQGEFQRRHVAGSDKISPANWILKKF